MPPAEKNGAVSGLLESPFTLAHFINDLPLAVVVLDLNRSIVLANRALEALTGFDADAAAGTPCKHILRSNLCTTACPALKALETKGQVWAEGDIINRERQLIPIRISSAPLTDEDERVIGFVETFEDLRGRAPAEELLDPAFGIDGILGRSPKMMEVSKILPIIAQTDSSVLITGETGTGKDLVAERIHEASARKKGPFIKVNCGAVPETLLESELFGHKKGAFTGAVGDKPGRFRLAHGGTLFLTEVGDLPLTLQVKLLTFLDDKVVYPLGSTKGFEADVRVIAATHRQLERMAADGVFREDLLFRLNVVRVHLPPLRDRGEDKFLLVDHFLNVFNQRFGKHIKGLRAKARALIAQWPFRGNVRELRNVMEYAANICQESQIGPEHLPSYLARPETVETSPREAPADMPAPKAERIAPLEQGRSRLNWAEVERGMIIEALIEAKGKKSKAAEILGWGRSTLWRKMKSYGLDGQVGGDDQT